MRYAMRRPARYTSTTGHERRPARRSASPTTPRIGVVSAPPESGFGLVGLAERVRSLGGSFSAAPSGSGGLRRLGTAPAGPPRPFGGGAVTDRPIRLVIADDHALVRSGLSVILNAEPDLEVVGDAADGPASARLAASFAADVVLMDIEMPGGNGILGTELVLRRRPSARVIVLTTFDLDDYVFGALRAGASAFLLKTAPPAEIADAIRSVHNGDMLFAPTVTRRLVETYVQRSPANAGNLGRVRDLTGREQEVLRAVARGLSNVEIGRELFLGEATVKTHVTRILAKLGLRDRVQAVVAAYESGFVSPGRPDQDR